MKNVMVSLYLLIFALGIPFFAILALLESSGNPLLTRDSTKVEIDDRI